MLEVRCSVPSVTSCSTFFGLQPDRYLPIAALWA